MPTCLERLYSVLNRYDAREMMREFHPALYVTPISFSVEYDGLKILGKDKRLGTTSTLLTYQVLDPRSTNENYSLYISPSRPDMSNDQYEYLNENILIPLTDGRWRYDSAYPVWLRNQLGQTLPIRSGQRLYERLVTTAAGPSSHTLWWNPRPMATITEPSVEAPPTLVISPLASQTPELPVATSVEGHFNPDSMFDLEETT